MISGGSIRAAIVLLVLASSWPAEAACILYEHADFEGRQVQIGHTQTLSTLGAMDNKASSVRVDPSCIMIGYDLPGLKGPSRTWGAGSYGHLSPGWDDVISSVRCNCRPEKK